MSNSVSGYVIYDGPSEFDGSRILAIVNGYKGNSNRKIGKDMLQVYIISADAKPTEAGKAGSEESICGDCKHRPKNMGSCYVNLMYVNPVYKAWQNGNYVDVSALFEDNENVDSEKRASIIRTLFTKDSFVNEDGTITLKGHQVRFGAYGDPAAVPFSVWEPILQYLKDTNGSWTGYTHAWHYCDQRFKSMCMASTDTIAEYRQAKEAGWRTFRIRAAGDKLEKHEFICPASDEGFEKYGRKIQCQDCMACNGGSKLGTVAINVHGLDWKIKRFTEQRHNFVSLTISQ